MSFDEQLLKEFTFFVNSQQEQLALYKLEKIGIERKHLSIRSIPKSPIRRDQDYVAELVNEEYIQCVNCNHVKISHSEEDICYGLTDNQNCNCKKYISIS